jgi:hypothetical protein
MESRLPFEVLIRRRPEVFPAISHWLIACNGEGCAQAASLAVSQAGEARAFAARSKAVRSSTEGHKLGRLCAERSPIAQTVRVKPGVEQCATSTTAPSILLRSWCWRQRSTKLG